MAFLSSKKKKRGEHRYYLLPGMGRSNREHRRRVQRIVIFVAIVVAILFGLLIYYSQSPY